MIEINLIPDVKQELIKAQRTRNRIISFSILVSIVSGGLVVFLVLFLLGQKGMEILTDNGVTQEFNRLSKTEDINNMVTIQNQLSKISSLHENKGINSRIFDIISAVNPPDPNHVGISRALLDPSTKTITLEGSAANSFTATETLKKTILNTTFEYSVDNNAQSVPLAQDVSITNTSYGTDSDGSRVLRFTISFVYPDDLLSNKITNARIVSPTGSVDVTDSKTRLPESLFTNQATDTESEGTN